MDLKEKTGEVVTKVKQNRKWQVAAAVAVVALLALVAFCSSPAKRSGGPGLPVAEAFDSLASVLPKGSVVVARFPDAERADMYYMNSGVLYCFNGKSKLLEEMSITGVPSGSYVDAKLSQDEKFIMLTVRQGKLDKLYRLNTMNRNIVDMDKSTVVDEDIVVVEEKPVKAVQKKSEVPVIDGHEPKKESAEPKKQEPVNTPEVTTISTE